MFGWLCYYMAKRPDWAMKSRTALTVNNEFILFGMFGSPCKWVEILSKFAGSLNMVLGPLVHSLVSWFALTANEMALIASHPFTALLAAQSLGKTTSKSAKSEIIKAPTPPPPHPFAWAREMISIKMHSVESRFLTGSSNILSAGVYVCTFQPGIFYRLRQWRG